MNRSQLQELSRIRLREAKALLDAGHPSGAYYLAGYAVECALKACIAKRTARHDFPDKKLAMDSYTHNLTKLVDLARLQTDLGRLSKATPKFWMNWAVVQEWSEVSRYETYSEPQARALYDAIADRTHGVHKWIKRYW